MTDFLADGPADAPMMLLAHGAGAPMDSPFMTFFAEQLAARDIHVKRFEFSYMAARRETGRRRPPPRAETLTGEYLEAIEQAGSGPVFIAGKSMGGRIASLLAEEAYRAGWVRGLICLGYPFHPPGKPDKLRTAQLEDLTCPALIVQGERDPFGTREQVARYRLSPQIAFHWASNGNHDLVAPKKLGPPADAAWSAACDAIATFVSEKI